MKFTSGSSSFEEEVIPATGIHDWTGWSTTVKAGCETSGKEQRTCKLCYNKEEREIPAAGHIWKDTRIIKQPTNVEPGIQEQKCDICNKTREVEIPPVTDFNITPKTITINQSYSSFKGGYVDCWGWGGYKWSFVIKPVERRSIERVTTSNKKVVSLSKEDDGAYYFIDPVGVGTATITCEDEYGNTDTCTIKVTNKYMAGYIAEYTYFNTMRSGDKIKGHTLSGATVSAKISGKKYSTKANGSGNFSMKIPVVKVGTKVNITVKCNNGTKTYSKKIAKPGTSISVPTVYRTTKTIKVTAKKVHKGDTITIKVGKKSYTKKIKKDASKITYKQKIKRTKEGSKIKITVKNKFKQNVYTKSKKVYYASKIKKGMTKKQCKLVPGWEHPDDIYVSGNITTWWYDDNGDGYAIDSYLQFKNGRLIGWHY